MKKELMDSDYPIKDLTPEEIKLIATTFNKFEQNYLKDQYFKYEETFAQNEFTRSYFHKIFNISLRFIIMRGFENALFFNLCIYKYSPTGEASFFLRHFLILNPNEEFLLSYPFEVDTKLALDLFFSDLAKAFEGFLQSTITNTNFLNAYIDIREIDIYYIDEQIKHRENQKRLLAKLGLAAKKE